MNILVVLRVNLVINSFFHAFGFAKVTANNNFPIKKRLIL